MWLWVPFAEMVAVSVIMLLHREDSKIASVWVNYNRKTLGLRSNGGNMSLWMNASPEIRTCGTVMSCGDPVLLRMNCDPLMVVTCVSDGGVK